MAREDNSNNQAEIKSYGLTAVEWPPTELEEYFFNVQQEHDYIVPLKEESNFSDTDGDSSDDVDNVEIKQEPVEVFVATLPETVDRYDLSDSIVHFIKTEPNDVDDQNSSDSNNDATLGLNGPDDSENVNSLSVHVSNETNEICNDFQDNDIPQNEEINDVDNIDDGVGVHLLIDVETPIGNSDEDNVSKIFVHCSSCGASFAHKSAFSAHLTDDGACKTDELLEKKNYYKRNYKPHICDVCGKTLSSRDSMKVHLRQHSGVRPYICPDCNKSFYQKAHLTVHIESKHKTASSSDKQRSFYCARCNVGFARKRSLVSHVLAHDKPNRRAPRRRLPKEANVDCAAVSIEYEEDDDNHEPNRKSESDNKKKLVYPCPVCCKPFTALHRMRAHRARLHDQIHLQFSCIYCSKPFLRKSELELHVRMHTAAKPFSCDVCGVRFSRKSIMETHRTLHTGEKPFVCPYCHLGFNRKSKLKIHLSSHTGQYAYCAVCNRQFADKSYIISHFKRHTVAIRKKSRKFIKEE